MVCRQIASIAVASATLIANGAAPWLTIRTLADLPSAEADADRSPAVRFRRPQADPRVKLTLLGCQLSVIMAWT